MMNLSGVRLLPEFLDFPLQLALVEIVRGICADAPLIRPVTRGGRPMSVRMTSAGRVGWVSGAYAPCHPSGRAWPVIPDPILEIWRAVVPEARQPESCLVNFYDADARMGLHQDRDEQDLNQPVVSISLGDAALFRVGGSQRGGKTRSAWLCSGDVAVLEGPARMAYHGIDRIRQGSSALLPKGGRINLTLRVVD